MYFNEYGRHLLNIAFSWFISLMFINRIYNRNIFYDVKYNFDKMI